MMMISTPAHFLLSRHQMLTLSQGQGGVLRCDLGQIWVTVDNDRQDFVLKAGESLPLKTTGKVVVQALLAAELHLIPRTI